MIVALFRGVIGTSQAFAEKQYTVIPAKAGIQRVDMKVFCLDSCLRRNDESGMIPSGGSPIVAIPAQNATEENAVYSVERLKCSVMLTLTPPKGEGT